MDQVTIMELTYYITTGLTAALLTMVGFFLRQFYRTVKELAVSVDGLKLVVSVEGEKVSNMKENQKLTNVLLDKLHTKVDNHEIRISVLETKA